MKSTVNEDIKGVCTNAPEEEEDRTVGIRLPYMGVTADENLGRILQHLYDDDCEACYLTCAADDDVLLSVLFAGPDEYCFSVSLEDVIDGTLAIAEDDIVEDRDSEAYTLRVMAGMLRRQAERLEERAEELSS